MPTFAEIVTTLSETTRERLLESRGARIDPRKVISAAEQTMRVLCVLPRDRWAALGVSARTALERLVPAPGSALRAELGGGALALVEAGLGYAVGDQVVCPAALRIQLPSPTGEDPRSARALYSQLSEEAMRLLLHGALRGRAGGPRPLGLGELLERVEDPSMLTLEIESMPREDRNALAAIEARGGEVSRDSYLELTREPARYSAGAGLPMRGPAHTLLAAGLVIAVAHDRYVLPTEVARVAGRERREVLARKQSELVARIEAREEDTLRARLAIDPGPLAIALLVELSAIGDHGRTDRPVARTTLARIARALDVQQERADLLVTLARSLPLRTARMRDIGPMLVSMYRTTALGDETRLLPPRASRTKLGPTGIVTMRELALETLGGMPRGRFVPYAEVITAAKSDLRAHGIELGLRELARTAPSDVSPSIERGLEAILTVSLPALGLVDVGDGGSVRLASRFGRTPPPASDASTPPPRWEQGRAHFEPGTLVSLSLAIAAVSRAALDPELVLVLDPSRAEPMSIDRELLQSALRNAECPPDVIAATLHALPAPRAIVHSSDVVRWVPIADAELRERLLSDPIIARDVVPNGPESGLLVHAHGTFPRLVRLFARHGVDLRKPS